MSIIFHVLKHHLPSLKQFVLFNKNTPVPSILPQIKSLGNSTFDMYIGALDVGSIHDETTQYLTTHLVLEEALYQQWINKHDGFREFTLSDKTAMTLRYLPQQTYIHLHPSRHTHNTLRIKANAMKTALLLHILDYDATNINHINKIRIPIELSPIKQDADISEIIKCYQLICH